MLSMSVTKMEAPRKRPGLPVRQGAPGTALFESEMEGVEAGPAPLFIAIPGKRRV